MMTGRASLVVAVALACSARAHAQPADKQDAQSLLQSGVKLLEAKDYLSALAVFQNAYDRFPSAKILLNIGTTMKLLGRDADAANTYQRYLDAADTDPKRADAIRKLVADLDKTVGRLEITVTPADAEVQVGSSAWLPASAVARWRVPAGSHEVLARRDGHAAKTVSVNVTAGQAAAVALELTKISEPTPAADPLPAPGPSAAVTVRHVPPRARVGVVALGHFDIPAGGAALLGVTADVTDRISLRGAGVIGPYFGGYAGATFALLTGRYRPFAAAGTLVFAANGARYTLRGAGGLEYVVNRHLALIVEVGVERNLNVEMGTARTLLVPGIGATGRL